MGAGFPKAGAADYITVTEDEDAVRLVGPPREHPGRYWKCCTWRLLELLAGLPDDARGAGSVAGALDVVRQIENPRRGITRSSDDKRTGPRLGCRDSLLLVLWPSIAGVRRGESMRKLFVLASLGVVVALATVAGAEGAIVSKTTLDLTGLSIVNPCNGDTVTFSSGTETITVRETDAGSGRVNVGEQLNIKADGVGATGAAYRWNENDNVTNNNFTVDDNGAVAENVAASGTIVGQGSVPNFKVHLNEHLTITPDGTVRVDRLDLTSNC